MKRLSIIVPIYGVEKYIYKFLETLTPNLQKNIEVILVDDGSKDNCGKIIDEYASEHSDTVTIIHKANGGVSSARNVGMEKASGEYLIFFDPDDYIAKNFTKTILAGIDKYNAPDVILFDYYDVMPDGETKLKYIPVFQEGFVEKEAFFDEFIKDRYILSMLWCKVIKRGLFNGLTFREDVRVMEDSLILTDVMLKINTAVYIKEGLYYYCPRIDSLTKSMNVDDARKCVEIAQYRYQKYKTTLGKIDVYMPVKITYWILQKMYIDNAKIDVSPYENFIKNHIGEILCSNEFNLNMKKQCILVCLGLARKYNAWKYRKSI